MRPSAIPPAAPTPPHHPGTPRASTGMSPPSLFTRLCANRRPLSWLVALWTPPPDAGTVPLPGGGGTCLAAGKWATFAPGAAGAACRSRPTQRVSKRGPHPGAQALAPTRTSAPAASFWGRGASSVPPFLPPCAPLRAGGKGFVRGRTRRTTGGLDGGRWSPRLSSSNNVGQPLTPAWPREEGARRCHSRPGCEHVPTALQGPSSPRVPGPPRVE